MHEPCRELRDVQVLGETDRVAEKESVGEASDEENA